MPSDVTQIIQAIHAGDQQPASQLLPLVYEELRSMAAHKMSQERAGQTLQPTALVHEAFLKLVAHEDPQTWEGRGHFFAAGVESMRRILIDGSRRRNAKKRAGKLVRVDLPDDDAAIDPQIHRFVSQRYR